MDEVLSKIYYNPKTGLVGANKLLEKAKELYPSTKWTKEIVQTFLTKQKPAQIYKVKKMVSIPITAPSVGYNYQADLMDVSRWSQQNHGIHFILCVIDIFSRYAWAFPIKNKTATLVAADLAKVFKEKVPVKIGTDNGSEFLNSQVRGLMDDNKVIHMLNEPGDHHKMLNLLIEHYAGSLPNLCRLQTLTSMWII
jgi:hypothetical protein